MDFLPELIVIVEWATVAVTFILMASGLPTCVHMYKERNTENVPYGLFLISVLVSILSLNYGILINNTIITFINGVAVFVWGTYIAVYILVSRAKVNALAMLLAIVAIYSAHSYYLTTIPPDIVIPTMGKYLIVWCTVVCLIPSLEIYTMIQEASTKCCDVPLLFGGTLCSSVWLLYGFLLNDYTIYFPNILGLLVSAVKFGLMFVYGLPYAHSAAENSAGSSRQNGHIFKTNSAVQDDKMKKK